MYVAILARGGLLMASAFVNTFFRLVRDVFHRKNQLCWALLIVFLGLAYGNAGVFNYTINTMFIPLIVNLKQNQNDLTQLEVK